MALAELKQLVDGSCCRKYQQPPNAETVGVGGHGRDGVKLERQHFKMQPNGSAVA